MDYFISSPPLKVTKWLNDYVRDSENRISILEGEQGKLNYRSNQIIKIYNFNNIGNV